MFYAAFPFPRCSCLLCHPSSSTRCGTSSPPSCPIASTPIRWAVTGPRIGDRLVFDELIQALVLDAAYDRIADSTCSATTIRRRRDEWITAGIFIELEQIGLEAYDRIVGLDLEDLTVDGCMDGCIVRAPCGGEAAGKSPVDRGKLGTKRSLLTDSHGIPLGCVIAPANRHDSPFLRPTLEHLSRFDEGLGVGLPENITVHLDAGYDSTKTRELLDELGRRAVISQKGFPLQAGVVEGPGEIRTVRLLTRSLAAS